ncbi:hypothetical protein ABM58_002477 [Salmonella enterica subsp. enterica]|nr:hypothetical protein [Salmonella enterica subsp. enterica serovar Manchester]EDG5393727.1 hypothetical protein [Salmonella enterica subsp. enterica serovar Bovismorbificans]EEA7772863.1 hypothetical protein [Salmonella enterica subsp. enterica serovar Manchester]
MNAKDVVTVSKLKKISGMEDALARQALREGHIPLYVRSMAVAGVAASAAEIIERMNNEISALKAQLAGTNTSSSDIGKRVFIVNNPQQEYIILADLQGSYMITPTPANESEPLTDVHIIGCDRIVFIDAANSSAFNA